MKKLRILLILIIVSLWHYGYGQSSAIGLHITASEYDGDLNGNEHHFYNFKDQKLGGAISFQQYLNRSFNLVEKISFNQVRYQNEEQSQGVDADFWVVNLKLKYKFNNGYILKEGATIAPFLVAGIGGTYIDSKQYTDASNTVITDGQIKGNVAVGVGILFQFNDRLGLEVANTVNAPLYDGWDGVTKGGNDLYLQHSAGLILNLRKPRDTDSDGVADRKDKCADTPSAASVDSNGCPMDTDKDGVADYLDKCPTFEGTADLNGCPDKDKDNVADNDDKCPDVPGIARFGGCPDSDNDGTEDSKDKCPNIAGLDIFEGCADGDGDGVQDSQDNCAGTEKGVKVDETGCPADSDGDGVTDAIDRCPTSHGDVANNGCPVVKAEVIRQLNSISRGITFGSGKAILKPASYPMLDEVVSILAEYKDYTLNIDGYTDSNGSNAVNMQVSQARVDAVKAYLGSKGADENRIEAKGFGEEQPVATNATPAGRAQNRRVELSLVLK